MPPRKNRSATAAEAEDLADVEDRLAVPDEADEADEAEEADQETNNPRASSVPDQTPTLANAGVGLR